MAEASARHKHELTIGELASMTRLTTRALRHYDHIGLLHPARVDPVNGYRYYDAGQIVSASTIAVLRGLDVDVETIGHILDGTRQLREVLDAEKARRERDARRAAAGLAVLESLATQHQPNEISVVERPALALIGTSVHVLAANDVEVAAAAFDELFNAATEDGLSYDPDGLCIIRRSSREQLHLDICIRPLTSVPTPPAGYQRIELEAGPTATLLHHGPLESLPLAHAHLHSWILDNDAHIAGPACETYVGDLSEQTTLLAIPIRA